MKILLSPCHYIYDELRCGSEYSWAYNIADRIASKYANSVIITGFKNIKKKKPYKIIEVQNRKKKPDMNFFNAILFNIKYSLETEKQLKINNFDILHHVLPFSINSTFNPSIIFRKQGIPSIIGPVQSPLNFLDTDLKPYGGLSGFINVILKPLKPLLSLLAKKTLQKANRVIAINEYTKTLLIRKGVDENRIDIIPPGIDTLKYKNIPFDKKRSDVIELLVVCNLVKRKAVDLTIKAINEVIKEKNNVILRIVGNGPQKKCLEALVKELELESYVVFEGLIKNSLIHKYYTKSHIFINMSRTEGFATVCLEAMASGLAIISSKVGGFSDAITDGKDGFLVDQEDYQCLSKKIIELIRNPDLIIKFGGEARKKAELKYDWDISIIPKYLDVYNKALANKYE